MGLEVGDQLLGSAPGLRQAGDGHHHAHADRVGVGVEESAAGDAAGAAEHLDVDTLCWPDPEALVDDLARAGPGPL